MDDEHDLPTPQEIADVTGGDVERIRDGVRAFEWVEESRPCTSGNIDETPGVGRDIRPTLRDYRRQGWHWIEQSTGEGEE